MMKIEGNLISDGAPLMSIRFQEAALSNGRCWGYETNCSYEESYSAELGVPKCSTPGKRDRFYKQADFGYVAERSRMHDICISQDQKGSKLRCSDDLRYCQATNIFFHFKSWTAKNSKRYREDVVQRGEVGGNCAEFKAEVLVKNQNERGYLRSWADEFLHFESVPSFSVDNEHCDVIFDRPTVVMKLDASVNMYHHFCDFVNLYASQHINGSFSQQVDVVWWDTHSGGFVDSWFGDTWKAFTDSKPVELTALAGRRVCFRNAMFPLLARQAFGLYYNTPLEKDCYGTGLMHAFAHHVLHRLGIQQKGPLLDKIRVTILSRSTKFRRILNLDEVKTLKSCNKEGDTLGCLLDRLNVPSTAADFERRK
nr:Glycosyltransferase AER61 domain containing protein [Haemonchus contortus]